MDPRLKAAITEGKALYDEKFNKDLIKAKKWVDKNLFRIIKNTSAKGRYWEILQFRLIFQNTKAIKQIISEINGLTVKDFLTCDALEVSWSFETTT